MDGKKYCERNDENNSRLECPDVTGGHLSNIVKWLKLGDICLLHYKFKNGQIWHYNCSGKQDLTEDELDNIRVIWYEAKTAPGILNEGEWPYYLKTAGISRCKCSLSKLVVNPKICAKKNLYVFSG